MYIRGLPSQTLKLQHVLGKLCFCCASPSRASSFVPRLRRAGASVLRFPRPEQGVQRGFAPGTSIARARGGRLATDAGALP